MKLVDFVTRNPKHLDLYFSDFSTNYNAFSKFAILSSSTFCRLDPGIFISFNWRSLVGPGTEERQPALFRRAESPAVGARLGENGEEFEPHL